MASGSLEPDMTDTLLSHSELVGLLVGVFVDDLVGVEAIHDGRGRDGDGDKGFLCAVALYLIVTPLSCHQ
jgi:hypothetical protein